MGFVPGSMEEYRPWLEEGFRRAGNGKRFKDFSVHASVHVEVDNDVAEALGRGRAEAQSELSQHGASPKNIANCLDVSRRACGSAGPGQGLPVIGYVGSDRETRPGGAPHLHFQIHPGRRRPGPPVPHLRAMEQPPESGAERQTPPPRSGRSRCWMDRGPIRPAPASPRSAAGTAAARRCGRPAATRAPRRP